MPERPKPGLRLETLFHLSDDFYIERVDDLSWGLYRGGFTAEGRPKHTTFHGSLHDLSICVARYKCRELSKTATSLKDLEAKIAEAAHALLKAAHATIDHTAWHAPTSDAKAAADARLGLSSPAGE